MNLILEKKPKKTMIYKPNCSFILMANGNFILHIFTTKLRFTHLVSITIMWSFF